MYEKTHSIALAETNGWTDAQAINALPVFSNGHALEEFRVTPEQLKIQLTNHQAPTLRALFEHMDRVMRVICSNRAGRNEFKSFFQKED